MLPGVRCCYDRTWSDLLPHKFENRVVGYFRLIIQNQRPGVRNECPLDMWILCERFPGILERTFVETICGVSQKLLVETRYERQQRHGELSELTRVVRSHELREVTDF